MFEVQVEASKANFHGDLEFEEKVESFILLVKMSNHVLDLLRLNYDHGLHEDVFCSKVFGVENSMGAVFTQKNGRFFKNRHFKRGGMMMMGRLKVIGLYGSSEVN
jgi:hypothetical protein